MPYRILLVAGFLIVAAEALAQPLPVNVARRGATAGLELSDGEPISYVLEHARLLDLTEGQRVALMDIRRWVRRVNAPFLRQLDSLRALLGISFEARRLTDEDMRALARLDTLSQPVVDSMRVNNEAAKREARALLQSQQVVRLDSLATMERGAGRGRRPPPNR